MYFSIYQDLINLLICAHLIDDPTADTVIIYHRDQRGYLLLLSVIILIITALAVIITYFC